MATHPKAARTTKIRSPEQTLKTTTWVFLTDFEEKIEWQCGRVGNSMMCDKSEGWQKTCKSRVLSGLIWMSVQHIQVEGLSTGRAFSVGKVLWGWCDTLIKTLTECTKHYLLAWHVRWMKHQSLSGWVQHSFKRPRGSATGGKPGRQAAYLLNTSNMQSIQQWKSKWFL